MDYYDLDQILLLEEKVPVVLTRECDGLGWLSRSPGDTADLGAKLEVPLWLAAAWRVEEIAEVQYPQFHGLTMRNNLQAGASVVSFQKCPYFYQIGLLLAEIMNETDGSARDLPNCLANAYKSRFQSILDKSRNWQDADYTKFTNSLDRQEQTLFLSGYLSQLDFDNWKKLLSSILKPSHLFSNTSNVASNFTISSL